ncbi:hypothetical protein L1887_28755 [Cichorium endivia]|nr:hypothetical protein L1887_28755 [Cichorium endivia]
MERKRRSSHRLRENWKPKFKNTAGTALDLKEDDDFVSPPKGLRRLGTRMTPGRICEAASGLSPQQKEAVEKMCLGTLLRINIDSLPGLLNYYLFDSYDDASDRLILHNTTILVTKQLISKIMGFEASALDFNSLPSCEKKDPLIYVYIMKYETIKINKQPPFIVHVTTKRLSAVEQFEINSGGFGKRETDLRDEEYVSEPELDIDEMGMFLNKIFANVDIGFKKILKEIENMEIALSAGVPKEMIQLLDVTTTEKGLKEKGTDVEIKELKHYVRRKRKLPRTLKSPFVSCVVSLSSKVISTEKDFCDSVFVSTRDDE